MNNKIHSVTKEQLSKLNLHKELHINHILKKLN